MASVLLEHRGPISTLTLNRPEALNAIDSALARDYLAACQAVAGRTETRVLVLRAEGRAFMAGGDIGQFAAAPQTVIAELVEPMGQAVELMLGLPIPVLGSVSGVAAGAGVSLMLACDLVLAADSLKLSFAYGKLGASCDLGISWTLPRIVGLRKALEIALLGEPLDAATALSLGLVNRVVAQERLAEETAVLAERLSQGAPLAMAELKRLFNHSLQADLGQQLAAERDAFQRCMASADFAEGVASFLGKRPAHFQGR